MQRVLVVTIEINQLVLIFSTYFTHKLIALNLVKEQENEKSDF